MLTETQYIKSSYQKGISIRKDIYLSQFSLSFVGKQYCEQYDEDDREWVTYSIDREISIDKKFASITDAIWFIYFFTASKASNNSKFSVKSVVITDRFENRVLSGDINNQVIDWYKPLMTFSEIEILTKYKKELLKEASFESGWDNFETARQLRNKAANADKFIGHQIYKDCKELKLLNYKYTFTNK